MSYIILILILITMMMMSVIFIISKTKKCSIEEATKIFKNFTSSICNALLQSEQPPEPVYPVIVGYDGYRIVPRLVDEEFSAVRSNFSLCYINAFSVSSDGHSVKYRFAINRKPDSPDDESLQLLIQKQTEEILTRTLLSCDCYMPSEPLTAVELKQNCLYVAFARTQTGIQQLDEIKQRIRRRQIAGRRQAQNENFREQWENGE